MRAARSVLGHLGRVVGVVVEHADAVDRPHELEASVGARVGRQLLARGLVVDPEPGEDRVRGGGVGDVVGAGHVERERPARVAAVQPEARARPGERRPADPDVGVRGLAERDDLGHPAGPVEGPAADGRGELDGARVVGADHEDGDVVAPWRTLEPVRVRLRGPPVAEVVGVDVGDDGDLGRVLQERPVALVRLDDHHVTGAEVTAALGAGERAADDVGGVEPGAEQGADDHRRRRGLAVRARDRDPAAAEHQRPQRGAAVQHPQAPAPGLGELGVVLADGGGDDDGLRVAQLLGAVPHVHVGAAGGQPTQVGGVGAVAAADARPRSRNIEAIPFIPEPPTAMRWTPPSSVGGTSSTGSSDATQPSLAGGPRPVGPAPRPTGDQPAATASVRRARTVAASRLAVPARARVIAASRAGSPSSAGTSAATQAGVHAASLAAGPRRRPPRGRRCAPAPRCRAGRARTPTAARPRPSPSPCPRRSGPA